MNKLIKNKKGVTLIELIVAMAMTVIILAAATQLINPFYSYYFKSVNDSKAISICSAIEEKLDSTLSRAAMLDVSTATSLSQAGYYTLYVGTSTGWTTPHVVLKDSTSDVSASEFLTEAEYEGFTVSWEMHVFAGTGSETWLFNNIVFTITLTKGTYTYTRDINIYLMSMSQYRDFYYVASTCYVYFDSDYSGGKYITYTSGGTSYSLNNVSGTAIYLSRRVDNRLLVTYDSDPLREGPVSILSLSSTPKTTPSEGTAYKYYSLRFKTGDV